MSLTVLGIVYLVASSVSFVAYGIDKGAAVTRRRRIPESYLHLMALAGGWPGAFLAQRVFRHKCSKRPFLRVFALVAALNSAAAIAYLGSACR